MRWNKSTVQDTIKSHLMYLIGPTSVELNYDRASNYIKLSIYAEQGLIDKKYVSRTAAPWTLKNCWNIVEDLHTVFKRS